MYTEENQQIFHRFTAERKDDNKDIIFVNADLF